MNRQDYFLGSMKAKAHYDREWILRAMTVVIGENGTAPKPWSLRHTDKAVEVYVPNGNNGFGWEVLEGAEHYQIPFVYHDDAGPLRAGDVENLKVDLPDNNTWGDLLFNSRVLVYALGERYPYTQGQIIIRKIATVVADKMISDVPEGEEDPEQIYVKHYKRLGRAIGDLCGYEIFIPSMTEKSLQPPPDNKELRDKLLAENKDQLDDPVIQAKIQDTLIANYMNMIKGDPSEGFLLKAKSFKTAIKRMFLIHGPEGGFEEGGRATLITNSLLEGLDINYYPEMVNSLRAGSFFRGALTALAGEDVDLMSRVFQNAKVVPDFCNTEEQFIQKVEPRRIGRNFLIDGKIVQITADNLPEYNGRVYPMYAPPYCKTEGGDICAICAGAKLAANPDSLGSMIGDIPSVMMARMMASAHAKALQTTDLDVENFLR